MMPNRNLHHYDYVCPFLRTYYEARITRSQILVHTYTTQEVRGVPANALIMLLSVGRRVLVHSYISYEQVESFNQF